jgi:hypothetical protein
LPAVDRRAAHPPAAAPERLAKHRNRAVNSTLPRIAACRVRPAAARRAGPASTGTPAFVLAPAAALLLLALLAAAPAAAGTWKWRDADGQTVYSDRPPPPGSRVSQLLAPRDGAAPAPAAAQAAPGPVETVAEGQGGDATATRAGQRTADPAAAAQAEAGDAGAARTAPAPNKWVALAAASRKQAEERAKADKLEADAQRRADELARACEGTRSALRSLESGMRVNVVDAKGEPSVLDDAERASRIDEARRTLADRCSPPS